MGGTLNLVGKRKNRSAPTGNSRVIVRKVPALISVPPSASSILPHDSSRNGFIAPIQVALEEERRRIARELHDDFGQRFCLLRSQLADLLAAHDSMSVAARQCLEQVAESVRFLSEDIWKISQRLHPSILEIMGLAAAIDAHSARFCEQAGLELNFCAVNVPENIPAATATALFRVTQEALHNAAKYASGSTVIIRLKGIGTKLRLSIRDNGPGFNLATDVAPERLGLKSMEERARLVGARFQIKTGISAGVSIFISAPLNAA
jgi:signal transduction histidine kinase